MTAKNTRLFWPLILVTGNNAIFILFSLIVQSILLFYHDDVTETYNSLQYRDLSDCETKKNERQTIDD